MERPMKCKKCGEELGPYDNIYTGHGTDIVIGCSICIDSHNATEWYMEQELNNDEYHTAEWRL